MEKKEMVECAKKKMMVDPSLSREKINALIGKGVPMWEKCLIMNFLIIERARVHWNEILTSSKEVGREFTPNEKGLLTLGDYLFTVLDNFPLILDPNSKTANDTPIFGMMAFGKKKCHVYEKDKPDQRELLRIARRARENQKWGTWL